MHSVKKTFSFVSTIGDRPNDHVLIFRWPELRALVNRKTSLVDVSSDKARVRVQIQLLGATIDKIKAPIDVTLWLGSAIDKFEHKLEPHPLKIFPIGQSNEPWCADAAASCDCELLRVEMNSHDGTNLRECDENCTITLRATVMDHNR